MAVTLQYLPDRKPESGLAPKTGTMERYRLMEWLNFVSTEIHKQFGPLFNPKITAEWRVNQLDLLGRQFTVADAYLFTVLNWSSLLKVDLGEWPRLKDYITRVAARPAVKTAMSAEGLRK